MGVLRVDLLDGHSIRGVDRGGKFSFSSFSVVGKRYTESILLLS